MSCRPRPFHPSYTHPSFISCLQFILYSFLFFAFCQTFLFCFLLIYLSFVLFFFCQFLFFLPQFSDLFLLPRSSLTLSLHLIIIIRLQVPRLALRRRLNALSGSVCRPTPWRRRPIAFLYYILSASALRPLANRVRAAAAGWLLIGQRETGREGNNLILSFLLLCYFLFLFFILPIICSFLHLLCPIFLLLYLHLKQLQLIFL